MVQGLWTAEKSLDYILRALESHQWVLLRVEASWGLGFSAPDCSGWDRLEEARVEGARTGRWLQLFREEKTREGPGCK